MEVVKCAVIIGIKKQMCDKQDRTNINNIFKEFLLSCMITDLKYFKY